MLTTHFFEAAYVISHGRCVVFQMAEVAISHNLSDQIYCSSWNCGHRQNRALA